MIYLDNAATTSVDPEVFDAMKPYFKEYYGNPGSLHAAGRKAYEAVEKARKQVADFIDADPSQIIFTSGGTEANNMVFHRVGGYSFKTALVSAGEHESVLKAAQNYYRCIKIPLLEAGWIDFQEFVDLLSKNDVGIVSVMHTNNETGMTNNVREIAKKCHEYEVPFHTDCVQAAGYCRISVEEIGCDFLSLSSHKIRGPKGLGALYVRNPGKFEAMISGGSMQEFGLRGGTENVPGIVGFGAACKLAAQNLLRQRQRIDYMSHYFFIQLFASLADNNVSDLFFANGNLLLGMQKTYSIGFKGISNEALLVLLDARGVCVSAGSACTASEHKASHVLTAMGISEEMANNSIRISFSPANTVKEVEKAAKIIGECVAALANSI